MNLALRLFAGVIDLLQFIFFITLLAFQFMTPVGGGITGAAAGAYLCYNASSGVFQGIMNAVACAAGGGALGGGLSFIAAPAGIAIDIAMSCTFGVLLILVLWATGRFSLMATIMGFGSEMLPGINAFSPGWSILVHRSIQQYKKEQGESTPRTLSFLTTVASTAMPEFKALTAIRATSRYTGASAALEERQPDSRVPLQTRNFDGIRASSGNRPQPYVQTA